MAVNGVEIEIGQKWKNRGGEVVTVDRKQPSPYWPWVLSNGASVNDRGFEEGDCELSPCDILELVESDQPKYTVQEFYEALQNAVSSSRSDVEKCLANKHDPEYKEYVRLKAKFES